MCLEETFLGYVFGFDGVINFAQRQRYSYIPISLHNAAERGYITPQGGCDEFANGYARWLRVVQGCFEWFPNTVILTAIRFIGTRNGWGMQVDTHATMAQWV